MEKRLQESGLTGNEQVLSLVEERKALKKEAEGVYAALFRGEKVLERKEQQP